MDLADALQAPPVRRAAQRSKYLEDALAELRASGQKISGWGELAAKLGATGLTQYAKGKSDSALQEALAADFRSRGEGLLESLTGPPAGLVESAPPDPVTQQPGLPGGSPQGAPGQLPAPQGPLPGAFGPPISPAQPQAAAPQPGGDIIGRLWSGLIRQESGGDQSAVSPKGAFGRAQLMPDTASYVARRLGDPSLAQRARTDPAVNERLGQAYLQEQMERFGNPAVALAAYNAGPEKAAEWVRRFGMPQPGQEMEWAARITYPETRNYVRSILGASPQEPPTWGDQSPQVPAPAPGQAPAPPVTPAPASQVPAQEPPPASVPPGVGGNPLQATPQEIALVRRLLSDPRTFARGEAMVMKLQERAAAPREQDITTVNGMPFAVDPYNPTAGARAIPIPPEARDRLVTGQQAGIPGAPQGAMFSQSPTGATSQVWAPPSGYQSNPNGGQTYIPGGANDPTTGENRIQGLRAVRQEIAPIMAAAASLQRSINSLRAGFAQGNGPGDLAMINGFQKLIDEGVVKGEDVDMQLQVQGIQGGLAGLAGFIQSNGKFDPRIRQQIARAGESIYARTNGTFRDRVLPYQGMVERTYGAGAWADVLPNETIAAMGWEAQPARQCPAPGTVQGGYRFKGGNCASQSAWEKVQ